MIHSKKLSSPWHKLPTTFKDNLREYAEKHYPGQAANELWKSFSELKRKDFLDQARAYARQKTWSIASMRSN